MHIFLGLLVVASFIYYLCILAAFTNQDYHRKTDLKKDLIPFHWIYKKLKEEWDDLD